jgi:Excalibur calcium-binding domain
MLASLAFASGSSGVIGFAKATSPSAGDLLPRKYPNCKALNTRYRHGVGRRGARDKTKSGEPVTMFLRNNRLYERNRHLDRDKDRIACEKR